MRDKATPSEGGYAIKMCPAAGTSPTAQCPAKPNPKASARVALGLPVVRISAAQVPQALDSICANKSSVTFPPSAGGKFTQDIRYKTPEWNEVYARGRNYREGFNAYVKDHARENLESAGRQRVRGFAHQCILTAVLVTCANYRKIVSLPGQACETPQPPMRRTRARRRTEDRRHLLPEPHAPPSAAEPEQTGDAA